MTLVVAAKSTNFEPHFFQAWNDDDLLISPDIFWHHWHIFFQSAPVPRDQMIRHAEQSSSGGLASLWCRRGHQSITCVWNTHSFCCLSKCLSRSLVGRLLPLVSAKISVAEDYRWGATTAQQIQYKLFPCLAFSKIFVFPGDVGASFTVLAVDVTQCRWQFKMMRRQTNSGVKMTPKCFGQQAMDSNHFFATKLYIFSNILRNMDSYQHIEFFFSQSYKVRCWKSDWSDARSALRCGSMWLSDA